jgi:hypothetical protein
MITKLIAGALIAAVTGILAASATEPLGSRPEEVAKAYIAARDVGNVEAALAFFSSDGLFQLPGGARFANKDELRRLHEMFAREQVHTADLRTVMVKGNTVILNNNVSTAWLVKFGFTGMPVFEIVHVDGDHIVSLVAYYPISSLLRMEQACRDKPDVTVPIRPCSEVMPMLRAHTERLISEGSAESN